MNDPIQDQNQESTVEEAQQPTKKERREQKRQEQRSSQDSARTSRSVRRVIIWIIALLAIAGAVVGVYYFASNSSTNSTNLSDSSQTTNVSNNDWVRGNPEAQVTLIEYGDFQCPACGQFHPLVKGLKDEFGDDVQFVFRHFPLVRIHPNAIPASKAAEAAGLQGKFWEMHDILFERQKEWSVKPRAKGTFITYAEELGLDIEQFEEGFNENDLEDKINEQLASGVAAGVNATPTFFLNGAKLDTPSSYDDFRNTLAQAIAAVSPPDTSMQVPAGDTINTPEMIVSPETQIGSEKNKEQ